MPSNLSRLQSDVSAAQKTPFSHEDVPCRFWVIDLSKKALGSEGLTYTIYYKTGDYAYQLRLRIEELLSGEVDEGCTMRLFSAGVEGN